MSFFGQVFVVAEPGIVQASEARVPNTRDLMVITCQAGTEGASCGRAA